MKARVAGASRQVLGVGATEMIARKERAGDVARWTQVFGDIRRSAPRCPIQRVISAATSGLARRMLMAGRVALLSSLFLKRPESARPST